MIGAGTIISPIIKIVTTVAILAAIYFFFVKPTLDTTENIVGDVNQSINESFDDIPGLTPDTQEDIQKQIREATKQADEAFGSTSTQNEVEKLANCITRVAPDAAKISDCQAKFSP